MPAETSSHQLENSQQPIVVKGEKMIDFQVNKELSQPGSEAIVKTLKIAFPIIKKYITYILFSSLSHNKISKCPPNGFDAILHLCYIWCVRIYFKLRRRSALRLCHGNMAEW